MLTDISRRRDFPSLSEMTYLNTAAESIPPQCVGTALQRYYADKIRGMQGREQHFAELEACREVSARLLRLAPAEVAFCSCSSEAYNLLASALALGPAEEVVVTNLDFPAGATPWLRAQTAPIVRHWRAHDGALRVDDLAPLLNENTRLVQVSLVSFYNGHRIDWAPFHQTVRRLAPHALISADITQAFGRVELDCAGADIVISSTHKWTLGVHGGCIVGVPSAGASRLTTRAGGWLHLENAFAADRFDRAVAKSGAASFAVGMPSFAVLYALNASLRYLENVGVAAIAAHANPLTARVDSGLRELGLQPLCAWQPTNPTGIVAFRHGRSPEIHAVLERENVHVMHNAGRIRISIHGYNTPADVARLLTTLAVALR
ncbi:MAG: aminotransferase class V-fold PLP-dependent enzyme [Opitutus sp.]|nr:aminotransferase class V-fold PLP-dependent enzyme [Opitutus sp.]